MENGGKTKAELLEELAKLRRRLAELEAYCNERERSGKVEKRYQDLYENAPIAFFSVSPHDGSILRWNRAALELLGYDSEAMGRIKVFDLYAETPDGLSKAQKMFRRFQRGESIRDVELQMRHRDGYPIWISLSVEPVRNEEGAVTESRSVVVDISGRKRAEQAAQEARDYAESIVNTVRRPLVVLDSRLRVVSANRSFYETFKVKLEETVGRHFYDLGNKEWNIPELRTLLEEILPKNTTLDGFEVEQDFEHIGRRVMILNARCIYKAADKTELILLAIEDVTDRRSLEAQFLQAQKMETVGRLAGGVAHDFNNMLTSIAGYADLAMMQLLHSDPLRPDLEEIVRSCERAAGLTRQLLAFSRRQIMEVKVVDLNDILLDMDKMLRRLLGEDIELVTLPGEDLGPVEVDPGQIGQVIANLAINARDAMPGGGKLTIETTNITLDKEYARTHMGVSPGDYVMLAVSDTGVGMNREVKSHLFEPFFTTKERGKGTGLGLATCYGIVKQSRGYIWVYSEPEKGTTVKIYLPRVEGTAEALPKRIEPKHLPRGSETVLLVEDERSVREVCARMLREQGYTVLEAATGEHALRQVHEYTPKGIDLLVTDIVMPHMGGKELADRIRTEYPEIRVLFMSGYTDNAIVHHGVVDRDVAFLQKPFSRAGLARKVRELLEG